MAALLLLGMTSTKFCSPSILAVLAEVAALGNYKDYGEHIKEFPGLPSSLNINPSSSSITNWLSVIGKSHEAECIGNEGKDVRMGR